MAHFDLCVIGSGSGNSLIDEQFDDQSVALVDKGVFGGTCLNVGCIPTKMFVRSADLAAVGADARRVGVELGEAKADWRAIRDRIFGRIDPISAAGEQWREQNANVTLFRDPAHFVAPHTLAVGEQELTADRFVIAAGSRPRMPEVSGADEFLTRLHTSDTIMRLNHLPRSLIILGGGSIAAEFAHIFSALGTKVTIVSRSDVLLRREDRDIAEAFTDEIGSRVAVRLRQTLDGFERGTRRQVAVLTTDANGIEYAYEADTVLVAQGRIPNGDTLNLEATGVALDDRGFVVVDEYQRTTADGIFALGDVCSPWELKHVANHEMRVVQHNLLHPHELMASDHRFVPQAIFSDPQVAWVGLTEAQAQASGQPFITARHRYADVAYGWALEDEARHFCKVIANPDTRQLLGAHIIGPDASVLIQPLIQAMSFGLTVDAMARGQYWIHPALTEVVENALLKLRDEREPIG